jgi:hypothetical protein
MYWFGWIGSSLAVATALTALSVPILRQRSVPSIIGWVSPLICMVLFVYLLRAFFFR